MSFVPAPERRAAVRLQGVTIQQRIRLLALIGMLATAAVAVVAFVNLQRSRELTRQVAAVSAADRTFLDDEALREKLVGRAIESLWLTVADPVADRDEALTEIDGWTRRLAANSTALSRAALPGDLEPGVRRVDTALVAFAADTRSLVTRAYDATARATAAADLPGLLAASDAIDTDAAATPFRSTVERLNEQAGDGQARAEQMLWIAAALAVATLLVGAQWVLWRIRTALGAMTSAAARMTAGDLTTRVGDGAEDEIGQLGHSINTLAATLADTFGRLEADANREAFSTQLNEALDMVDTEGEVHDTVARAMAHAGSMPMELLLSDSSHAHLERSAVHPAAGAPGCSVESPFSCAAVRRGNPVTFESSRDLNACPKLRGRAGGDVSAVCVPVSFMGRALGVLHATSADGAPPAPEVATRLAQVATLVGSRIGTVRAFEQTQLQAATDALTGLPNRRTAESRVRALLAEGQLFSFAMADLDFFKRLNDSHGHETGDRALRLFARVLSESVRAGDVAARWGGEEFAVVIAGQRAGEAAEVLERVRARLAEATLSGEAPVFTASFGVVDSTIGGSLELLVRTADNALYAAKEAGRDRVVLADAELAPFTNRRFAAAHDARIDVAELLEPRSEPA